MREEEEKARIRTCPSVSTKTEIGWSVLRVSHTCLRAAVISVPFMSASIESTWAVAMSRFF